MSDIECPAMPTKPERKRAVSLTLDAANLSELEGIATRSGFNLSLSQMVDAAVREYVMARRTPLAAPAKRPRKPPPPPS